MSEPSKVYFASLRLAQHDTIPDKFRRLLDASGLADLDLDGKFVAIKTHIGEEGNVTFLRPLYTRVIADAVRELGGTPFVTDCSTLYPGLRSNAVEHHQCAELHGFTSIACGCQFIAGDGLRGTDEAILPIPQGSGENQLTEAYIGSAIMNADIIISLTHSKGCTAPCYGGVIKNLGMGCASRAGKAQQHADGMPQVDVDKCIGCGKCIPACGQKAISIVDGKAHISDACLGCSHCIPYCRIYALRPRFSRIYNNLNLRMAEYAAALCTAKPGALFHVAIAIDITPTCDCFTDGAPPMVPDVGMFASMDPVALDQAVADAICAQEPIPTSTLPELHEKAPEGMDHLHALNPGSDWELQLEHAAELGIGTREYELVEVK